MAPTIEDGRVKALGTSGKVRSPILPNVPTIAEAGIPGLQRDHLDRRDGAGGHAASRSSICSTARSTRSWCAPDIQESWQRQGANTMVMTPEEFGAYIQSEIERWAKLINANNIGIN